MLPTLETRVRQQQLQLLRLEKKIRNLAPVVIATGLSFVAIEGARADLAALHEAKQVFQEVDHTGVVSRQISEVEEKLAAELGNLAIDFAAEKRLESLASIVDVMDSAHRAAEVASLDKGIRLLGQRLKGGKRADGGTPKEDPPNLVWFKALLKK